MEYKRYLFFCLFFFKKEAFILPKKTEKLKLQSETHPLSAKKKKKDTK